VRWLVDGYNVIRRSPELASREAQGLEAARRALCALLGRVARASAERFVVVFDGTGSGAAGGAGAGVEVVFSSARETADRVLARMAAGGGAVVSSDREVRRAAEQGGAIAVTSEDFLAAVEWIGDPAGTAPAGEPGMDADDEEAPAPFGRGRPGRLPKKERERARALARLRRPARPR
jgi:uncharacterized protein